MKKENYKLMVGLLAVVFGVLAGIVTASRIVTAPAGSGARILKLSHSLDSKHPIQMAVLKMQEDLDRISGGKLKLDIYPGAQLGNEREVIEQVQLGAVDICAYSTSSIESFCSIFGVFSMPYIFRDSDHYWKVLNGPIGKSLLDAPYNEKVGLKGLCYFDAGARSFYFSKTPIHKPSDLKGKKIRVINSKVSMSMIKAMGGIPTPLAWGEIYTAMQQGLIDGAENNEPSFFSSRHCEVAKYLSLDEHTRVPDMLFMSKKVWDSLGKEQRGWLKEAAQLASDYERKLWQQKTVEALDKITKMDKPVTIIRPDKKPFQESVQPLLDAKKGTAIGDLIEKIRNF